jgi:predicted dehydrogenase
MTPTGRVIRWGVLGVAKINERLFPAFRRTPGVELRAIASRTPDKARAAAAAHGIPVVHESYDGLLADPKVDVVYIPLPNHLHGEWTMRAADHGKHVLCEKPLAADAAEAARVVAHCRARNVRLMDGYMWPHHPRTRLLRQCLDSGEIGDVRRMTGSFSFSMPLDSGNIRLQEKMAGGSVMDVGCYPVYLARWLFRAEPVRVFATAQYRHGVDVCTNGVLEFSGDRVALFDCAFTLPLRMGVELVGTQGMIRVPEMWLPPPRANFFVARTDGTSEERALDGHDQMVHMLQNFSQAVRERRHPEPSANEAIGTMRVLDALRASARRREAVAVG